VIVKTGQSRDSLGNGDGRSKREGRDESFVKKGDLKLDKRLEGKSRELKAIVRRR
jgi:hypothetical protein